MSPNEKNKELTKRKLIQAVGEVMKTEGYRGLGVNKIARVAGVHKKLIYRYFISFDRLIEAYVTETDYWITFADVIATFQEGIDDHNIRSFVGNILINQFNYFSENFEMQQFILWELSTKSDLMRSIHRVRELKGQEMLKIVDQHLKDPPVNFRAVAALLVGGIYYITLHTKHNGGMFSDVDVHTDAGRADLKEAIQFIVDHACGVNRRT